MGVQVKLRVRSISRSSPSRTLEQPAIIRMSKLHRNSVYDILPINGKIISLAITNGTGPISKFLWNHTNGCSESVMVLGRRLLGPLGLVTYV